MYLSLHSVQMSLYRKMSQWSFVQVVHMTTCSTKFPLDPAAINKYSIEHYTVFLNQHFNNAECVTDCNFSLHTIVFMTAGKSSLLHNWGEPERAPH